VSELKEIKKDLGNYTENPDQYIQAFREVSQNFELSWKDIMLLLSQTLTSLETQWVLDQAVTARDNYHLKWPYRPVSEWALTEGGGWRRKTKTLNTQKGILIPNSNRRSGSA
jgi:hypothetical protein